MKAFSHTQKSIINKNISKNYLQNQVDKCGVQVLLSHRANMHDVSLYDIEQNKDCTTLFQAMSKPILLFLPMVFNLIKVSINMHIIGCAIRDTFIVHQSMLSNYNQVLRLQDQIITMGQTIQRICGTSSKYKLNVSIFHLDLQNVQTE